MSHTLRSWFATSLAVVATSGLAVAQAPAGGAAAPATGAATPVAGAAAPAQAGDRPHGDLPGPIDNINDLQDTGRMMFKMADTNNDGMISQKEAIDAGNLTVGGFFFRADQNGDGVLSQDEAKAARDALFQQQPLLRFMVDRAKRAGAANGGNAAGGNAAGGNAAGTDPAKAIGNLLDTNNDKQIQATEVRQAVQTAVQGGFAMADTNRDNQLSPTEVNAAIIGAARTAAQAMFQQADDDHNGSLSRAEFDKAIVEPANMLFAMLDANNDGQLSQAEADSARRIIGSQLQHLMVPEPANSARNLIRAGARPDQVAPVPSVPASAVTPRR